jgi:hypothetical protein
MSEVKITCPHCKQDFLVAPFYAVFSSEDAPFLRSDGTLVGGFSREAAQAECDLINRTSYRSQPRGLFDESANAAIVKELN